CATRDAERVRRGNRRAAPPVRRFPELDAGRAYPRILGREHRVPPGDHPALRLAPDGQDDREFVHPCPRDPPDDDLAEGPGRALDHRSHEDHRGAREAQHRACRAARAPALAGPRRARREVLRLPRLTSGTPPSMASKAIVDTSALGRKRQDRGRPKGRQVDPHALAEIKALLGDAPRRRDLLIEHLHKIQDRYGHISAAHVVALAAEMKLAMTEVYEVATFYHHFDVIKDGETPPAPLTVRVCDSLSCEMAGARELIDGLKQALGAGVRVIPAPCIGRCEQAPAAVVGQNPVPQATVEKVKPLVAAKSVKCPTGKYIGYAEYRKKGGYQLAVDCLSGKRDAE